MADCLAVVLPSMKYVQRIVRCQKLPCRFGRIIVGAKFAQTFLDKVHIREHNHTGEVINRLMDKVLESP